MNHVGTHQSMGIVSVDCAQCVCLYATIEAAAAAAPGSSGQEQAANDDVRQRVSEWIDASYVNRFELSVSNVCDQC